MPAIPWTLSVGGTGDASYMAKLTDLAEGLPVHFMGLVDPDSFFKEIDCLVISSLWNEPAARVVYEAGISGVLPIVTDRGGLPELVAYGKRGYVFDPDTPSTLWHCLSTLVEDPSQTREMLVQWKLAAQAFLPECVAKRTLDIYEAAIRDRISEQVSEK